MSQNLDYFADMLVDGEQICAAVAGPGSSLDGGTVWLQIAATEQRVLVVELQMSATGSYQPVHRLAAPSTQISVDRYPKTENEFARLELHGFEKPVVMVEIDRTDIFPNVEPFIVAWGGRLGGAGAGRPPNTSRLPIERQKVLILASLFIAVSSLACACGGIVLSISSIMGEHQ